ncbi:MAG TPA: M3 family metallopeptidase, partial [Stellaceae bacterium]|nr:M3 family metallopeptidase [Stellaceae bacterium]
MTDNPLFETWTTPFGLPPFDRIEPAHFPPAFDRGMEEELADIAAITGSAEPPTFANTIEALERSGKLLNAVSDLFHNLNSSATNKEIDAIARDYAPRLAAHRSKIALDPALFTRIDTLYQKRDTLGLAPDQLRLLERDHTRFVRAGALLGAAEKERMSEITARMASLHTHFGQNVLADEDEWRLVLDEGDLAGLPDFARVSAASAAKEHGLDGKYVITLSRSSVEPFLTFSALRDLRETAYRAWVRRGEHQGEHDNAPLIAELLALRQEQARLLGYDTYAA